MMTPVRPLPARQCVTTTCVASARSHECMVRQHLHATSTGGAWWSGKPYSSTRLLRAAVA